MKWFAIVCGIIFGASFVFYGIYSIRRRETAIGGEGEIWHTFKGRSSIVASVFVMLAGVAALVFVALLLLGIIKL